MDHPGGNGPATRDSAAWGWDHLGPVSETGWGPNWLCRRASREGGCRSDFVCHLVLDCSPTHHSSRDASAGPPVSRPEPSETRAANADDVRAALRGAGDASGLGSLGPDDSRFARTPKAEADGARDLAEIRAGLGVVRL